MQHLIEAARSKRLDRITVGYTVGAWAVVQATSIAAPAYFWPQWVLQSVITVALIGLPVALLGAWAVGVRAETGTLRPSRADVQVLGILSLFLAVAAVLFIWVFWPKQPPSSVGQNTPPANSLAVLPFANLSGNPGKRYLSEGISDELINRLAQVQSLRVAARTSSFSFEDRKVDAKTIARALNVHAVLEGSVREAGNRVRIAAQLVSGADGFQIWSESYDRELTDVLALQDDIARSVTSALTARLIGRSKGLPSVDAEAYRLYLQGKFYVARGNKSDLEKGIVLLEKAARRAPNFADGLAMLGNAQILLAYNYDDTAALANGERALRGALELNPRDVAALKALTDLSTVRWRWQDVLRYFRAILAVNPNSYDALITRSGVADTFGFNEESSRADVAITQLDPLSLVSRYNLAAGYLWQRKYDEAARYIREALALNPSDPDARNLECSIEVERGNLARARQSLALLPKQAADQTVLGCPFEFAVASGNSAQARAMVAGAAAHVARSGGGSTEIGDAYLKIGDFESAQTWYERAYQARERALLAVPRLAPPDRRTFFKRPQWKALWNSPPIREWQATRADAGKVLGVRK